ncbi:FecR domain-containing protein [Pedobacter gandavensis]|uniref:FecR family protein n=1 Tax=Pedobacter TaxID=84567 RepID=UPI001C991AC1|nr:MULTISPECIES: FecR family protein [Pedobacter]WGQ08925.1 FecR domain-containing protein [Pedobacter gandavensis]
MEENRFYELLVERYLKKQLTDQELELFAGLLSTGKLDNQLLRAWNADAEITEADELDFNRSQQRRFLWPKAIAAAAAVVLMVLSVGGYFYFQNKSVETENRLAVNTHDVDPGGNKATLTLADGSTISLTDANNGELAKQSGVKISKSKNGELVYSVIASDASSLAFNTISTPKGGIYQVNLPDGTKVWLNAASSIKFPTTFAQLSQRKVELEGEAYFEVAKNKKVPFVVSTGGQQVQVLGTHFNISSYSDEGELKTTLLEGSVKVMAANTIVLKPGQQSNLKRNGSGDLKVSTANIAQVMAWKNGFFHFEKENLHEVMRQLSRWYDIEVIYEVDRHDDEFMGDIPRGIKLSEALKILSFEGTQFRIEGRKLIVKK